MDLVNYLQKKLDAMSPGDYIVSKERNIDTDYEKHEVVVSALSGNSYKEAGNIPYQIDITTSDIDKVMDDFNALAKNESGKPYTQIINVDEDDFKSVTMTPFFNTPVVMEKEIEIGSNKYARITVFAIVNEQENVNNIKSLVIDNEEQEILGGSLAYVTEAVPARVSGDNLTPSKKRTSSLTISFSMISKSNIFLNKAYKIITGSMSGNTSFSVVCTLDNGLKATLTMFIGSYTLSSERAKLPLVNIGLFLYDNRGDTNAAS